METGVLAVQKIQPQRPLPGNGEFTSQPQNRHLPGKISYHQRRHHQPSTIDHHYCYSILPLRDKNRSCFDLLFLPVRHQRKEREEKTRSPRNSPLTCSTQPKPVCTFTTYHNGVSVTSIPSHNYQNHRLVPIFFIAQSSIIKSKQKQQKPKDSNSLLLPTLQPPPPPPQHHPQLKLQIRQHHQSQPLPQPLSSLVHPSHPHKTMVLQKLMVVLLVLMAMVRKRILCL